MSTAFLGATDKNRTCNLLITNQLRYLLRYGSKLTYEHSKMNIIIDRSSPYCSLSSSIFSQMVDKSELYQRPNITSCLSYTTQMPLVDCLRTIFQGIFRKEKSNFSLINIVIFCLCVPLLEHCRLL